MEITFLHWPEASESDRNRILKRNQAEMSGFIRAVQPIVEDVCARGDAALVEYEAKFNRVELDPAGLKVTAAEFDAAEREVPADLRAAIETCVASIRAHNERALAAYGSWTTELAPGVMTGEIVGPVDSVGLYIPGAKNTFPSTLLMTAVPALVAGVPEIAGVTRAREDGSVNPVTLFAAKTAGLRDLYKISGAHGIAALAFGTETVPAVSKLLGPGGPHAVAAKLLIPQYRAVDIGFLAGASESIVLADGGADPDNTVLDMINEAEHGSDSAGILVTHDRALAEAVRGRLPDAVNALPEPQRAYVTENMKTLGGIIVTDSLEQSLAFVNEYAPEHVLVKLEDPAGAVPKIRTAAALFVGELTPNTFGNFALGTNHSLPTAGTARAFSGASILQYLKVTMLGSVSTQSAFEALAGPAVAMARTEGFPGHENAVTNRTKGVTGTPLTPRDLPYRKV